jgi:transglutaminase-like putative cysteine protease
MQYKSWIIIVMACVFPFFTHAQIKKVKPEFVQKANDLKSRFEKANVAALSSVTHITFEYDKKSEKSWQVKGIEQEEVKIISLRNNYEFQNVVFYDDYSEVTRLTGYSGKGKKISFSTVDQSYESDGYFHTDTKIKIFNYNLYDYAATFQYNYTLEYNDVKYFTSVYFPDWFPIQEKKVMITVPEWLELEILEFNLEEYEIKKTTTKDKKNNTVYTYTAKYLDGKRNFSKTPGPSQYKPHLLFVYKSYTQDGSKHNMFATTSDLYNWYKMLRNNVDNDTEVIGKITDDIVEGAHTDKEKIEAIYYWVQDNIRYIAFEDGIAGFQPEACQKVYKKKYGDCKGMANLLTEMLKHEGFDARLTWIGTKRLAYNYDIPSLAVDNHMISTLFFENKKYFLDPTEDYVPFGEYANRIQGREVLIEDGDDFIIDKVPVSDYTKNKFHYQLEFSLDETSLVGDANYTLYGQGRTRILYLYNNTPSHDREEALTNYLSEDDKNISIGGIQHSDLENRDIPIEFKFKIKMDNHVTDIGEEMYISLDVDNEFRQSVIEKDRPVDVIFSQKLYYVYNIKLNIPDGYEVDYLPDTLNIDHPEYRFAGRYSVKNNQIVYHREIILKDGKLSKVNFEQWNRDIKKLATFYDDQIILKKIE